MMNELEKIVSALAKQECDKIAGRVIRSLQKRTDQLSIGDYFGFEDRGQTGLKNLWDEICVQVIEAEYSTFWAYFELEVINLIQKEVEKLPSFAQKAIWLQTEESDDPDLAQGIYYDAVYDYIAKEHVYEAARNWKNIRIMRYLHGEYASLYY